MILLLPSAKAQTRLFVDPEFSKIGNSHKVIAVVSFRVAISLRPKQMQALHTGDAESISQNSLYQA